MNRHRRRGTGRAGKVNTRLSPLVSHYLVRRTAERVGGPIADKQTRARAKCSESSTIPLMSEM